MNFRLRMKIEDLLHTIKRKWMKIRLQPIRVYCMHHVCKMFDAETMVEYDWIQIDEFKSKIQSLKQEGIEFISLAEAYQHICKDRVRCKKYAVLTFDDGYASLKEILPWLEDQKIPATLFINGKYMDGQSYRHTSKEEYLTKEELWRLPSPLIEIGSHGWEHLDALKMTQEEFQQSANMNKEALRNHPRYVPFYAYTYGKHNADQDTYLASINQVPVLIDGADNYNDKKSIQRRLL